jgi:hypothetical protein
MGPMKRLLDYIRDEELVPEVMDIIDESSCTFYDGCIIAEIHDRRGQIRTSSFAAQVSTPIDPLMSFQNASFSPQHYDVYRILLKPTTATLMADLNNIQKNSATPLSDEDMLELESRILVRLASIYVEVGY